MSSKKFCRHPESLSFLLAQEGVGRAAGVLFVRQTVTTTRNERPTLLFIFPPSPFSFYLSPVLFPSYLTSRIRKLEWLFNVTNTRVSLVAWKRKRTTILGSRTDRTVLHDSTTFRLAKRSEKNETRGCSFDKQRCIRIASISSNHPSLDYPQISIRLRSIV